MTLRHLKIFVAAFQNSNITKAAEELHLAQPSVSTAIRELEDYYGVKLFERIGRRIYPSECGREFYRYALHIVSLFETMETKIRNWDAIGTLRVGSSITIGTHILPGLIKKFQKAYPDLNVEVFVGKSSMIEQKVMDNSIDLGLIETNPEHIEIITMPFMQDTMWAIVPMDHPLALQKHVSLVQLSEYPFLMREKGSAGRELLDACFALRRLHVHPVWESTSTQAIVKGVSEGLGVAVLPYLLVERDIFAGVVKGIPLTHPLNRELNIIYHKSKFLTPNMEAFIQLCKHSCMES